VATRYALVRSSPGVAWWALQAVADSLRTRGQIEEALELVSRLRHERPRDLDARFSLIRLYAEAGRFDESAQEADSLVVDLETSQSPRAPEARQAQVLSRLWAHDTAQAGVLLAKARTDYPTHAWLRVTHAQWLAASGKRAQARVWLEELLRDNPADVQAQRALKRLDETPLR
jgi:predicted Zn-dependent protease